MFFGSRSGPARPRRASLSLLLAASALMLGPALSAPAFAQAMKAVEKVLSAKSTDTKSILAKIGEKTRARVIVMFEDGGASAKAIGKERSGTIGSVADELLATLTGGDKAKSGDLAVRKFEQFPFMALTLGANDLAKLAKDKRVVRVFEDRMNFLTLSESMPLIGEPQAFAGGATGNNTLVAVIDTGVDFKHPYFAGRGVAEACFSTTDAASKTTTVCPNGTGSMIEAGAAAPCPADGCLHGTHVAGIAAGRLAEGETGPPNGVAPQAGIIAIQVFSALNDEAACSAAGYKTPCTTAFDSDMLKALELLASNLQNFTVPLAAINMSIGGGRSETACDDQLANYKLVIDYLRQQKVATVIAAGNNGFIDATSAPGCVSSAVTVGASDKKDVIANFSNASPVVDLMAPGVNIVSAVPNGQFEALSGTSMAAPTVAGAFAALRSAMPDATVDDIEAALKSTGLGIPDSRPSGTFNVTRINVAAALEQLKGGPASAAPAPGTTPAPAELLKTVENVLSTKSMDTKAIVARLGERSKARVILMFEAGGASTMAVGKERSSAIAGVADALLSTLSGGDKAKTDDLVVRKYDQFPLLALTVGAEDLAKIAGDNRVIRVFEDGLSAPSLAESMPLIGEPDAFAGGATGNNVLVAVIDSGVDLKHPYFAGRGVLEACYSTTDPTAKATSVCPNGTGQMVEPGAAAPCAVNGCLHGTHVAGIAAGRLAAGETGPPNGVAPQAGIVAIQVFSSFNDPAACGPAGAPCILSYDSDQLKALDLLASSLPNFTAPLASINMSLGGGRFEAACDDQRANYKLVIDYLRQQKVATVIAAGNNGFVDAASSPGCISSAVTVGASDKKDVIASFSNSSSIVDLMAPGVGIVSSTPNGQFAALSGTSMAAPTVAGAFAALRSAKPDATAEEIEAALKATGIDIGDTRPSGTLTIRRINLAAALLQLRGGAAYGAPSGGTAPAPAAPTPVAGTAPAPASGTTPAPEPAPADTAKKGGGLSVDDMNSILKGVP